MTSTADFGRASLYAAESQVGRLMDTFPALKPVTLFGSEIVFPVEQKFSDLQDLTHYISEVLQKSSVVERFGIHPAPAVRERRGQTKAHYDYNARTIAVPMQSTWALRELVVLHELAHYLVHCTVPSAQPHGAEFASAFHFLVQELLGTEVAWLLSVAFTDAGVAPWHS